jgi:hypothetical protein
MEADMGEPAVTSKREWTPMTLVSVGRVGDLMRGGIHSKPDGGNVGSDKGKV